MVQLLLVKALGFGVEDLFDVLVIFQIFDHGFGVVADDGHTGNQGAQTPLDEPGVEG